MVESVPLSPIHPHTLAKAYVFVGQDKDKDGFFVHVSYAKILQELE